MHNLNTQIISAVLKTNYRIQCVIQIWYTKYFQNYFY